MFDEFARCRLALYGAIFAAFMGFGGRITGIEPLNNQFFAFALWTYILLADNLAYRFNASSTLVSRPEEFFYLAAWFHQLQSRPQASPAAARRSVFPGRPPARSRSRDGRPSFRLRASASRKTAGTASGQACRGSARASAARTPPAR